jgi:transposase-like protein
MHYLWRAVDHKGEVLESVFRKAWDKTAALTLIKKTLKRHGLAKSNQPDRFIIDPIHQMAGINT